MTKVMNPRSVAIGLLDCGKIEENPQILSQPGARYKHGCRDPGSTGEAQFQERTGTPCVWRADSDPLLVSDRWVRAATWTRETWRRGSKGCDRCGHNPVASVETVRRDEDRSRRGAR